MNDLRFAIRMLAKNPGFTAVAVLSLALGIGINSVIFSLVDGTMLRPLPFSDVHRVVRIFGANEKNTQQEFSYPAYEALLEESRMFSGMVAVRGAGELIQEENRCETISTESVSLNYFDVLGVRPILGRTFEDADRSEPVVVISHNLWQHRFAGDPQVLGKSIVLSERHFTVVGVAPKSFGGIRRVMMADVWLPVYADADSARALSAEIRQFNVLGRLSPGVSLQQAKVEMEVLAQRMGKDDPDPARPQRIALVRELDYTGISDAGDNKILAYLCLLMVGFVLVVACSNVSGLLLAQAEARRREIATRLALGSTRRHLIAQFLKESLLLALLSAACCLMLLVWIQLALPKLIPSLPISLDLGLKVDVRVVAYTFFLAILAVLLFGLGPALKATRVDIVPLLKGDSFTGHSRGRRQLARRTMLVGQLTISFVFLALAGALVHCLQKGLKADFGFERKNMLLVTVNPAGHGYDELPARMYYQALIRFSREVKMA